MPQRGGEVGVGGEIWAFSLKGEVYEGWIQGCISYGSLEAAVIYSLTVWVSCYAILKKAVTK